MKTKDFFGKLFGSYLIGHLIAMVLVVGLLCLGVWYGLRVYTHHGEGVPIPDLTGMNVDKARDLLDSDELYMVINDSGYNKRMPQGCILAQIPGAGMTVKRGRMIYVTVNSLQSPRIALPDIINNSSYRKAKAQLLAMGFKLLERRIPGDYDWVYGVLCGGRELRSGDMVSVETPLTLVVGDTHPDEDDNDDLLDMQLDTIPDGGDDEFEEVADD